MPAATGQALRLAGAAAILHLLFAQPNHPDALAWRYLFALPLELPVALLGLAALGPGLVSRLLRLVLVASLTLISALKLADFATHSALARGFNPVADLPLVPAALNLVAGAAGPAAAAAAAIGAALAVAAVAAAAWWATGVWVALRLPRGAARLSGAAAVLFAGVAAAEVGHALGRWDLPVVPPGTAFTARVGVERVETAAETLAELRAFRAAAARDRYAGAAGLLDRIDRDVLVVFVESYGRASLAAPFHAEVHRATLAESEARLAAAGLSMASGLLVAPTRGGQSWLSHATFANGLWIDDQTRYGAALVSGRETLFHLAARSGFRTAAVMPQITLDWPESAVMGFDTILASADLGYRGQPFNWVTMPDQYTFAAMDRLLRDRAGDRPLFVQIALGSSHAPWTPVPELVPWEEIGDGRIFDEMAASGDPPRVVWQDRDRVRAQYRDAIDYALRTVFGYAARHAADPPLMFVIGDHQAAGFVALDESPDVPIHVIGPEALVAPARARLGGAGLIPDTAAPALPMDRMRDLIVETYSTEVAPEGGT